MNKKVKIVVNQAERTIIVAALQAYDPSLAEFAKTIGLLPAFDPADDGPEVELLNAAREQANQQPFI